MSKGMMGPSFWGGRESRGVILVSGLELVFALMYMLCLPASLIPQIMAGDRWFGREDLRAGHETTYQQWRDALDAQAQEKQVKTDEKKQKMRSEREMMEEEWKNRRQRMVPDEQWAYTPPFASEELKVILEAVNVIIPPKNTVEEMFHMEGLVMLNLSSK